MKLRFARFLLCLCCLPALAGTPADLPSSTSQRGLFIVSYQSELEPLQINRLHAWILHLENAQGEAVTGATIDVAGGMPEHDHGLATRPRITAELGEGAYRLEGLRFHMRGNWELQLTIVADGKTDTAVLRFTL